MIPKIHLIIPLALLFALPAWAQDDTQDIDWKSGAWGDLSQHIGTYHHEAVLGDERVSAALDKQMDAQARTALSDAMQTRKPIGFEDDCLLLSGNAASAANTHAAFIAVCLYKGTVHAALHDDPQFTLYSTAKKYDYLPYAMKMWVYGQKNPGVNSLPEGIDIQIAP